MLCLRIMVKLGLNFFRGLLLLKSLRGKIHFGLYWHSYISKTNREKIEGLWRSGIRILGNFDSKAPLDEFMESVGIDTISTFISYLYTKKKFESKDDFERSYVKNFNPEPVPERSRSLRKSSTKWRTETSIYSDDFYRKERDRNYELLITEMNLWKNREKSGFTILRKLMLRSTLHPKTNIETLKKRVIESSWKFKNESKNSKESMTSPRCNGNFRNA